MGKILLEDMEFFAYHGCFHEEQIIGTHFRVTIELTADTSRAEQSDHLEDTIDYQSIYRITQHEMEQKSNLLEHVAGRILEAITCSYPSITSLTVRLSKINPPVGGKVKAVTCIVSR